jgi:recombination protein RecA
VRCFVAKKDLKEKEVKEKVVKTDADDFTASLIRDLNKERGEQVAFNLAVDESPTHVKRWISTGILGLDYIISNRRDGGLPEGRIIEIFGPPAIGKSHIAAQICRSIQRQGGIAVYIDSETATSVENLQALGVDISRRFAYVSEQCTENILAIAESTILKTRAAKKDVPVVIIWDSVAGSSPKAELEGDYDANSVGLQARVISKGMRKITGVIGDQNVLFVILNQTRTKIGVLHGDPTTTPGGLAIPFHASVRIKLTGGHGIQNSKKETVGINVTAKTIKNRMTSPHRTAAFQIWFGVGIKEHEELFDLLRLHGPEEINGLNCVISGDGGWKTLKVTDPKKPDEPLIEKKFVKSEFDEIMRHPEYGPHVYNLLERALVRKFKQDDQVVDPESYVEVQAAVQEIAEEMGDLRAYDELSV